MKRPWFQRTLKGVLIVIVILGIAKAIQSAVSELKLKHSQLATQIDNLRSDLSTNKNIDQKLLLEREISSLEQQRDKFWRISPSAVLASVVLYVAGGLAAGFFWHRTLLAFGYRLRLRQTQAAYFLGNLGKYVPGKAMVLVIRAARLRKYQVPISVTIVSIFVETLTLIAVGAAMGAVAFLLVKPDTWLALFALALFLCVSVPTTPPVFRYVIGFLANRRTGLMPSTIEHGLSWSLFGQGWVLMTLGWVALGTSLWVLLMGMGATKDLPDVHQVQMLPLCIAAVAFSVVTGIVSLIPGGAGIRELVVVMLLADSVGNAAALAAAIVFRMVSLVSELLLVAITQTIAAVSSKDRKMVQFDKIV